jgi:hypothetical protein
MKSDAGLQEYILHLPSYALLLLISSRTLSVLEVGVGIKCLHCNPVRAKQSLPAVDINTKSQGLSPVP